MECFDPESGQVYRETIVKHSRHALKPWNYRFTGKKPVNVLSPAGADSLVGMVMRQLICNAEQLHPDALMALPSHTCRQIRSAIRRAGCESFHVWKSFAESRHEGKAFRHSANVREPWLPLVNYFLGVTSNRFAWIVDLTLADVFNSPIELRQLATISNLQTLYITYSKRPPRKPEPFDDDVLSNLAYRAATDGVLSRLQMIFLQNIRKITTKSLTHLTKFPALDTFCVVGTKAPSKQDVQYMEGGWHSRTDSNFMTYAGRLKLQTAYERSVSLLDFRDLVQKYIQKRRSDGLNEEYDSPSVGLSLGDITSDLTAFFDVNEITCFERNLSSTGRKESVLAPCPGSVNLEGGTAAQRPTKKRKLKNGKAISIDAILDNL